LPVLGLHHITLVCANAQRTVDFYTGLLGMRLVKKTVNFDDPRSYHLYFADARGSAGSAVTFFEWPESPQGRPGVGGTHHLGLETTDLQSLGQWHAYLSQAGLAVTKGFEGRLATITFRDPDGVNLQIVAKGEEATTVPSRLDASGRPPLVHGIHHIDAIGSDLARTREFYEEALEMNPLPVQDRGNGSGEVRSWGSNSSDNRSFVSYSQNRGLAASTLRHGSGQTHHFVLSVPDEEAQDYYRRRLLRAGFATSTMVDRIYFKSVYSRDPDGHIVELATAGPGFTADENVASLGGALQLPPWLAPHRGYIESLLTPLRPARAVQLTG